MNGLDHIQNLPPSVKAGVKAGVQLLPGEALSCRDLYALAQGLHLEGKALEAADVYTQVVLAPGEHPREKSYALNNLGIVLQGLGAMDKAAAAFAYAMQLNPKCAQAVANFGTTRLHLSDYKGANEFFLRAIAMDPKCSDARQNAAVIALLTGDFRRGWTQYEWRWKCKTFTWRPFKTSRPKWKGQDLTGKTILLTHEQGFGDSIQFIRYAKLVKARGAKRVRYLGLPELECILKGVDGVDEYLLASEDEDFDYHCPLLSLPGVFKTRLDTVPWDGPYIQLNNQARHFTSRPGIKAAIVWAGRKEHSNDKWRSAKLDDFAPLFDVPGVVWYSLQVGERAKDADKYPTIYSPPLKDFRDTAWWLSQMDLLISVDTAVVHLAGAMGRKVWMMTPFSPDWRWLLEIPTSPWYPTLELFRQSVKGQWGSVVETIKQRLHEKTAAR